MRDEPRLLRPMPDPLGLYLRAGYNDHRSLEDAMPRLRAGVSGIVFTPFENGRHDDLLSEIQRSHLEAVLDPNTIELATPGGFGSSRRKLPWAGDDVHDPSECTGTRIFPIVDAIANYTVDHRFDAVLAPTHYLAEGIRDPWLETDRVATSRLRAQLDAAGMGDTRIYYSLAIPGRQLRQENTCEELITLLSGLPVDALWVRVYPFGGTKIGPVVLRGHIRACRSLHKLKLPIVAEKSGAAGIALLAFGAVGGIEGGITIGETFDLQRLRRPPEPRRKFVAPKRVYLPSIGAFVSANTAKNFFKNRRMKARLGCRDSACCRRGTVDTVDRPKRHFINQRVGEIQRLSDLPEPIRPQMYLEDFLRPATDIARQVAEFEPSLENWRKQLDTWRTTLGDMVRNEPAVTFARSPAGRLRRLRGA